MRPLRSAVTAPIASRRPTLLDLDPLASGAASERRLDANAPGLDLIQGPLAAVVREGVHALDAIAHVDPLESRDLLQLDARVGHRPALFVHDLHANAPAFGAVDYDASCLVC